MTRHKDTWTVHDGLKYYGRRPKRSETPLKQSLIKGGGGWNYSSNGVKGIERSPEVVSFAQWGGVWVMKDATLVSREWREKQKGISRACAHLFFRHVFRAGMHFSSMRPVEFRRLADVSNTAYMHTLQRPSGLCY